MPLQLFCRLHTPILPYSNILENVGMWMGDWEIARGQKTPQTGVLCWNSQVLEDRQDFVACFALRSPPTRGSRYIRKPVVAFYRYLRPLGQSTAQWRMTFLLHDPRSWPMPENTNSRYSSFSITEDSEDCLVGLLFQFRFFPEFMKCVLSFNQ